MDIYIEYIIIDNMVINSLILWGTGRTLRRKMPWLNILLAAAVGTICAGVLPLLSVSGIFAVMIKILLGLIMVLIAADCKKARDYILTFLLFLAYTFLLGGLLTALLYGTADISSALTVNYMAQVPIGLIVLAAAAFAYFVYSVCCYIFRQKDYAGNLRQVELMLLGQKYSLDAFIDSGNMLYDSISGLPIVVVNKSLVRNTLADIIASGGKLNSRYIEIATPAGKTKMMIITPDKLTIYHKGDKGVNIIDKFLVGVSAEELKFDMLLHPSVIN